jgi:predicted O-methyltransferase YrrM
VIAKAISAKNILEIGTFCGFSTAAFARAIPENGVVFTCDEDTRYIETARKYWTHLGVAQKIHFELGQALTVLHRLTIDEPSKGFFDIAFIDADKENYRQYAELSMKLLRKGGLLIVDNTLWKGLVQYKESRDNSAEHIKALNEWVFETFGKNASLLPAWDGVTIVVKSE